MSGTVAGYKTVYYRQRLDTYPILFSFLTETFALHQRWLNWQQDNCLKEQRQLEQIVAKQLIHQPRARLLSPISVRVCVFCRCSSSAGRSKDIIQLKTFNIHATNKRNIAAVISNSLRCHRYVLLLFWFLRL